MAVPAACVDYSPSPTTLSTAQFYQPGQSGIEYLRGYDRYSGTSYFILRLDPAKVEIKVLQSDMSLAKTAEANKPLVLVNGGFFKRNGDDIQAMGLVVVDGVQINQLSMDRRQSGLLFIQDGKVQIGWAVGASTGRLTSALQAGPLVVEPSGRKGIRSDDNKLAQRTLVAIGRDGQIYIMVTSQASLFLLQRIVFSIIGDVKAAINLDGGASSGIIVNTTSLQCQKIPFEKITPTAIAVFPRK